MLRKTSAAVLFLGLACLVASGQEVTPKFEVASVRVSTAVNPDIAGGPGTTNPTQWRVIKFTLKNLIWAAYGVPEENIVGSGVVRDDRYDVVASMPAGTTKAQMALMLQDLLANRFGLQFHREPREVSGFELVVAKGGLKLKESEQPVTPPPRTIAGRFDAEGFPEIPLGKPDIAGKDSGGHRRTVGVMQTMPQLALYLQGQMGAGPVVDRTGLGGMYDYKLHHASRGAVRPGAQAPDGDAGPAPDLSTAVQEQLGLKLQPAKVPIDYFVVDSVLRVPTEN